MYEHILYELISSGNILTALLGCAVIYLLIDRARSAQPTQRNGKADSKWKTGDIQSENVDGGCGIENQDESLEADNEPGAHGEEDVDVEDVPYTLTRYDAKTMVRRSMDFYAQMNARRSCRLISDEPVPLAVVQNAIRTAGTSPSGAHTEPWTFAVVSSAEMKREIRMIIEREEEINYRRRMSDNWLEDLARMKTTWVKPYLESAPYLIVVLKQVYGMGSAGEKKTHYYNEISVSIAVGILLTALQLVFVLEAMLLKAVAVYDSNWFQQQLFPKCTPAFHFVTSFYIGGEITWCEQDWGDEVIRHYFFAGYTNMEIAMLCRQNHNEVISIRTVKRVLQRLGLRRRQNTDIPRVISAVQHQLDGSGSCLGYRSMTRRLLSYHRQTVPRETVREVMQYLDPEGVSARRIQRFSRRRYTNNGPNYLIHIDGYDKLKPFGFAVHGAIDGFSRRILWLKVGRTNNNPRVTAYYFMNFIDELHGVPRAIRMDRGTENVCIEDIQKSLRWDHTDDMSGENSVLYGSSHRNQRIERWWLSLRQSGVNYWINLMKDLESHGLLELDNTLHVECLRFCLTELLQMDLDRISNEWNQHACRHSSDDSIAGKPDLMYFLPEQYGALDYKSDVNQHDVMAIKEMCTESRASGCEEEFETTCNQLLRDHRKDKPRDVNEALELYMWLLSLF